MYRQSIKDILLLLGFVCAVFSCALGQNKAIGLEEALQMVRKNHPGLESGKLAQEQQIKLAEAGIMRPPTQITLTGEEFDFASRSGVHAINFQQNFYLPKTADAQRNFYKNSAAVMGKKLALTDLELERQVTEAYYQVLFSKEVLALANESLVLYENFLQVTKVQLETGETGRIPNMAARSKLGQAQLELEHAEERYQIASTLFNQWLRSDITYEVAGQLPLPTNLSNDSISPVNPHLQVGQAQVELSAAAIEMQEAKMLPQVNAGARFQTASGDFPLFGYQIGMNVPLFKKAYKGQVEAAEIGLKVKEKALQESRNKMERTVSELQYRLQHQIHILDYLRNELTPIVMEQSEVNWMAYQEGETGYLEYLDSLEQVVEVKQQYLTALYEFNALRTEMDYWLGR